MPAILGVLAVMLALPASDAIDGALRAAPGNCRLMSVIVGDSVTIHCPVLGLQRARLLGFDMPEIVSPGYVTEGRRDLQATWALRRVLYGSSRIRIMEQGRYRYGRALVGVWIDGTPLSRLMISGSHARPCDGSKRAGWCG
ncbi:MAG: hypothetical protein Q7J57_09025 [Gemmobacter sp.]|nr:hypothetical protein [Gemmobacter sp.]